MRRTSLVNAKAHLSEPVDEAEHRKGPVIILRHGKPAAAIVPVEALPGLKRTAPLDERRRSERDDGPPRRQRFP